MRRVASLVVVWLLVGCWTSASTGERLDREAQQRERRLHALEVKVGEQSDQLDAKVEKLERVLKEATELLARNSADRSVETRRLGEQIAMLEGQLAELRHGLETTSRELANARTELDEQITRLAAKAGVDMTVDPSDIPDDKDAHFVAAKTAYDAGEHAKSRALFREYVSRHGGDDRADEAQYFIGMGYLQEDKPATALGEFRKVIANYKKGSAVNNALLGMAQAFFELNACTDAKNALQALDRRRPSRALRKRMRELGRQISRSKACT